MKKIDFMEYKGYYGSVHFDTQERVFYGKIEFINDLTNYEAYDADSLIKAFYEAVDSYIESCTQVNKMPDTPFKGSFNIRIEPELHKRAQLYALQHGVKLNSVVKEALSEFLS